MTTPAAVESLTAPAPDVCPVCNVIKPGQCRNERGQKIWPAHWQRATSTRKEIV